MELASLWVHGERQRGNSHLVDQQPSERAKLIIRADNGLRQSLPALQGPALTAHVAHGEIYTLTDGDRRNDQTDVSK